VLQPTHRAGDAAFELLDQGLAIAIGTELGPYSQAGECLHLSGHIGTFAIALYQLEIVVIRLALAFQADRFEENSRHVAAGAKAHALHLAGGAIAMAEIGNF